MAATGTASTAQQRRSSSWLGVGLVLYGTVILTVLTVDSVALAKHLSPSSDLEHETGICKSVDIRNSLDSFDKLEGCRVVEGFVQILLFDNVTETLLSRRTFPLLTEITDFLLLYRVNGLRSIGQLFPNLAVIRGQNTFFSYAFIVFEMSSLQEIALYSLLEITHGFIRIDKNPSLCFLNSINWERIANEGGGHFIKSLKPQNECPICPGDENSDDETGITSKCPLATNTDGTSRSKHLCWNRQHCQKICPNACKHSCNANLQCCSSSCLGGCALNNTHACTVCKNLSMGSGPNRACMSQCQAGHYEFLERRCVTYNQCINMSKPIESHSRSDSEKPYKIHEKSCVLQCPTDYMGHNHTCIPCKGGCEKRCPGVNVDNIVVAKQLRGCTHIEGSLEIQIRGGRNVVNELEENLSMIEEIQGYLKVVRSFPLVSLNFLKNLKRIKGDHLDSQKYVFYVLDNQNLQDLWEWENRTLVIEKGSLFFHFNPKLCFDKIVTLQRKAGLANFTDLEVASNSNGDKIACDVETLEVNVTKTSSRGAILNWKRFEMLDPRKLLGYIVYLIEAPHKNITMYDGRDACGGDGWRLDDIANTDEDLIDHPLFHLKPYTQYAFYVKTYTIAKESKGAQSAIQYFSTQPAVPSGPYRVEVISNASDTFKVIWKPPIRPNGNITHYFVSGRKKATPDLDEQIDYCTTTPKRDIQHNTQDTSSATLTNDTCPCDEKKPSTSSFDEIEESNRIKFEDDLQNEVYVKRSKRETSRESFNTFPNDNYNQMHNSNSNTIQNRTEPGTNIWESFNFTTSETEFYITNLHHYTHYEILVQACREREGPDDEENNCSNTSPKIERTLPKKDADDIKTVHITNQSSEVVSITWDDPTDPNGDIYSYSIQYKRLDNENSKPAGECITRNTFLKQNRVHLVKNLAPGNYSLRVCATSAAGFENYSPYIYFHIEESTKVSGTVIAVTVIALLAITGVICFLFYRKNKADKESIRLIPSVNPEYVPSVYVPDEWEVPRKKIELGRELGQGSFGMVYEGMALDIRGKTQIKCAVKTVNEHATNRERLEFLNEASVMKAFDTAHVVRLLGVVSQGQPTLVIMELMAHGDLKSYLRSHRPDSDMTLSTPTKESPSLKQILQMAIEIADGMAYLAAKKFVHRDLAARNCMVAEDLTVKIGDFGMTRDIYETDYYRKGTKGLLPVRWMAPESLKDGVFTSNSDVWSYGVVLWEMATLASQPYQGLSNDQVLRYVINGGIMERPENCPNKLYALMRACWNHKAIARPSFVQLCYWLLEDASPIFSNVSFYHSPAGIEARNYRPTPSPSQDDPSTPLRITGEIDAHFSVSDNSDEELGGDIDTHINFPPSIPIESKDGMANGYVKGCNTKNDAATTQC